jgi:nitrous oxide reductase
MNHSNGIGQDTSDSIIRTHCRCDDLMLLYPFVSGGKVGTQRVFGMADGRERLRVAQIDVSRHMGDVVDQSRLLLGANRYKLPDGDTAQEVLVSPVI